MKMMRVFAAAAVAGGLAAGAARGVGPRLAALGSLAQRGLRLHLLTGPAGRSTVPWVPLAVLEHLHWRVFRSEVHIAGALKITSSKNLALP